MALITTGHGLPRVQPSKDATISCVYPLPGSVSHLGSDSVVAIAFPDMLRSFPRTTIAELSWVFNAYNVAFAAFLLPAGADFGALLRAAVAAGPLTTFDRVEPSLNDIYLRAIGAAPQASAA